MMRKIVGALLIGTVALLGSLSAVAQPYGPVGEPGMGMLHLFKALELTKDQRAKIADLRLQFAKETLPIRNELGVKSLELKGLMNADEPNQKAIEAKIDEIAKLKATLQKKRVAHRLAVLKVLTPEQREKLRAMGGPWFGMHRKPPCRPHEGKPGMPPHMHRGCKKMPME